MARKHISNIRTRLETVSQLKAAKNHIHHHAHQKLARIRHSPGRLKFWGFAALKYPQTKSGVHQKAHTLIHLAPSATCV